MAIENVGMLDAFKATFNKYPNLPERKEGLQDISPQTLGRQTFEVFTVGINYLINGIDDGYIQELAKTAKEIIIRFGIALHVVDNIRDTAIACGMQPTIAHCMYPNNDEPKIFFASQQRSTFQIEDSFDIFIAPESLLSAQNRPIRTLVTIAGLCSEIKDLANGRYWIDPGNIQIRANAAKAHIQLEAQMRHPATELTEVHFELDQYPAGIYGLHSDLIYRDTALVTLKEPCRN